jgi:hypothetical protein
MQRGREHHTIAHDPNRVPPALVGRAEQIAIAPALGDEEHRGVAVLGLAQSGTGAGPSTCVAHITQVDISA